MTLVLVLAPPPFDTFFSAIAYLPTAPQTLNHVRSRRLLRLPCHRLHRRPARRTTPLRRRQPGPRRRQVPRMPDAGPTSGPPPYFTRAKQKQVSPLSNIGTRQATRVTSSAQRKRCTNYANSTMCPYSSTTEWTSPKRSAARACTLAKMT